MNTVLRSQLGFRGMIVTDSLSAGAITAVTPSLASAAERSIAAGADVVLFGSTLTADQTAALQPAAVHQSFEGMVNAISAAVGTGALPQATLNAAVLQVLTARHINPCA
jgi:beta-N-acetylhexosaminidase